MRAGRVKLWNDDRGYGFIKPDDGSADVFAHASQIRDGSQLVKGDRVTFEDDLRNAPADCRPNA
jgi:cold shock CspA family protein